MHYSVQTEIHSQTQLCERLRHLSQFSSHLLFVSGESGSGKSTVCRHYVDSDFNQKTITIDARQCHDDSDVRTKILQQISYDGRFNAHVSLVDSLPLLTQQLEYELTLCIDNGMTLSSACITEFAHLVELSLNNKVNIKINIILFAESKWVDITMLQFAKSATNVLELEMPELDAQAAMTFVEQQFTQAGYKPTFINQEAISRQVEACHGNPAELIKCAQAIMQGQVYNPELSSVDPASKPAMTTNKSFYLAGIIAVLLLLAGGGSFLYDAYQTEQTQDSAIIVEDSLLTPPTTATQGLSAATATATNDDTTSSSALASDWDNELPTEMANTVTLTGVTTVKEVNPNAPKQRVVIDDAAVNKMIAKQAASESDTLSADKTNVEVAAKVSANAATVLTGKAWLMAQPANNYTFQLAGLTRESQLQQYLDEHKLTENIWTYQTQRNNKPWYVILYGSFNSAEQANAAKQQLPSSVLKDKPWQKRFAEIQTDFK